MINNNLLLESACDYYYACNLDIINNEIKVICSSTEKNQDITVALHRIRTSSRRIMEVISVRDRFLQQHSGKSLEKCVRRLLDISGSLRNFDVLIKIVNEMRNEAKDSDLPNTLSAFCDWLMQQRDYGRQALLLHLDTKLRRKLIAAAELLSEKCKSGYDGDSSSGYTLIDAAPAIFYTSAADITAAVKDYTQLHELRIKSKGFRYVLELFELSGIDSKIFQSEFKILQDALGSWHDNHVLLRKLHKYCKTLKRRDTDLIELEDLFSQREQVSRDKAIVEAKILERSWFDSTFAKLFLD